MKAATSNPELVERLKAHSYVTEVVPGTITELEFWSPSHRIVSLKNQGELGGLIELMDNNPLVCASSAWVPDAASTMLLIGFGPLAQAGIALESPSVQTNAFVDLDNIDLALATVDWPHEVTPIDEAADLDGIYAMTVITKVTNPGSWDELDDLFDERYSRSLFVRKDDDSEWSTALVKDQPFAVYRLRLTQGEEFSLVTVQILADPNGKCGSAQAIHMMNVMCGFEESAGIL